jgi:hypothetical protein
VENTTPPTNRPKLESPYPYDQAMIEQISQFWEGLTDDAFERTHQRCLKEGVPWISPDYYNPIFNIGMQRIIATTPQFAVEQSLAAEDPNNPIVCPSIARNLATEYNNKLLALKRIHEREAACPELVRVNEHNLKKAETAYQTFMKTGELEALTGVTNMSTQRQQLVHFVDGIRRQVLPEILNASQPVMEAGSQVLNIAFEEMGIANKESPKQISNKDPLLLDTHHEP